MRKNKSHSHDNTIAVNRRASFDYHLHEQFEAGLVLQGWEVKSLRAGKGQLTQSYVLLKNHEAFLFGAQITPLLAASTHIRTDALRTRKLLLNRSELKKLFGSVERKGFTLIPLKLYWKANKIKLLFALAQGKQEHDKRHAIKERDWQKNKQRILSKNSTIE